MTAPAATYEQLLATVPRGPLEPVERTWSRDDALLYAVAVGAGQDDPAAELEFTTENSGGVEQRVLPTFAVLLDARLPKSVLAGLPLERMVHGDQAVSLQRSLPTSGRTIATPTVTGVYDLGAHAQVRYTTEIVDAADGEVLATLDRGIVFRGLGGFGGERAPTNATLPESPPDIEIAAATRPEQALMYRLCRDRNRLHSDPAYARNAGFPRPILHGLCTFGFAGRALLASVCDGDPERFGTMSARFSRPVLPGDRLVTRVWLGAETSRFQVAKQTGEVVMDHGVFRRRALDARPGDDRV